jgi:hypothetical protein
MSMLDGNNELVPPNGMLSLFPFTEGNTFQNLNVSSPAPVTIFCPSGLMDKYSTLYVCPVRVVTFCIEGYFHTMI